MTNHYKWESKTLELSVYLQPGASKDEIIGVQGDYLKIKIMAPPIDGKANNYLCGFLAKYFAVSQSCVGLMQGSRSRYKKLVIDNPQQNIQEFAKIA